MPVAVLTTQFVWEDASAVLMARIRGNDGLNITQSNVTSIAVSVFDRNDKANASSTAAPSVASTVFDTLQTSDPRWTTDATGYNFKYEMPASFLFGETIYRVEIVFTPTSGDVFPLVYELSIRPLFSS